MLHGPTSRAAAQLGHHRLSLRAQQLPLGKPDFKRLNDKLRISDMGLFWDTKYTVIDKDGTRRAETALEGAWFDRYNRGKNPCHTFTKIGGILQEYKCTSTGNMI
jgi:hypothetical protein